MGRIKEKDYPVFAIINGIAKAHMKGATLDYDGRVSEYYYSIARDAGRKTFYFSDSTMKRVENMDISKLKSEEILPLCHKAENRSGIVLTSENYRRLCFGYTISDNQIIIGAYRPIRSSLHSPNPGNVLRGMWIGNVIVSGGGVEIIPSSLFSFINAKIKGANPKAEREDIPVLQRILREAERYPDAFQQEGSSEKIVFDAAKLSKDSRVPGAKGEAMAHLYKQELLVTVLKMFLFLKTASVIQQTYISEGQFKPYARHKGELRNYILVDSTWDGDITVINPFSVRGHFRHQPKKNSKGEWYRDLIYIDAFMKKGYHRKATKLRTEEC